MTTAKETMHQAKQTAVSATNTLLSAGGMLTGAVRDKFVNRVLAGSTKKKQDYYNKHGSLFVDENEKNAFVEHLQKPFPKREEAIQGNRAHVQGWVDLVTNHDNDIATLGDDLKKLDGEEKDLMAALETVRTRKLVIKNVS
jgi:hypothetical protein